MIHDYKNARKVILAKRANFSSAVLQVQVPIVYFIVMGCHRIRWTACSRIKVYTAIVILGLLKKGI